MQRSLHVEEDRDWQVVGNDRIHIFAYASKNIIHTHKQYAKCSQYVYLLIYSIKNN